MRAKRKTKHHKKTTRPRSEDAKQRKKYARGGRIEAYTFGETQKKKKDPIWG